MPSLTEQLDNLYTTTWQNMKSSVRDNIFDATPFWFWLRAHGGLESVAGGRFLTEPLRFAKSDNVKFIHKGSTMNLTDKEFLTVAVFNWRYLADSIVRFFVDEQQNRGRNQIISLMRAKLDNSRDSLIDQLETTLFASASGDAMHGLQDLVPDNPATSGAFGGIDGATDTWWKNQLKDMTGSSFTANGRKEMTTMLNNCMNNLRQDRTTIIVAGRTPYEYYEEETVEQRRVTNRTLGDAGFENIEFKGIPIIWSPAEPSNKRMYFLNHRFLKFQYDPQVFFDMTAWKEIPEQVNDRAAQIVLAGNLVTGRRRVHGVIHTIDTA